MMRPSILLRHSDSSPSAAMRPYFSRFFSLAMEKNWWYDRDAQSMMTIRFFA